MFKKSLRGVRVPHRKNTADCKPEKISLPQSVTIPMVMHIGAPAKPIVKPGDAVLLGQLIAEADGAVSSPIHSSVSGRVKKLENILLSGGQFVPALTIEADGEQSLDPSLAPPKPESLADFLEAVNSSGLVGLGGAGFPTAVKLSVKDPSAIEAVVINGAECEPYITSDTRTMIDEPELIFEGIALLKKFLQVKQFIIGIEDNKPQCIKAMQALCKPGDGVRVKALPALYPQGGEKVLIYHTTGKIVPGGKLPIDVGLIVLNCTSLAALAKYIKTGIPLVEKCVTVDGSAVREPKNLIVPIGTPVRALFDYCGGFKAEPKKLLYGGPMMGLALPELDAPVLKNTNAVLAFDEKEARLPAETNCIRCGRCVAHCPLRLAPVDIETAFKLKKPEDLAVLRVDLCMECGCCSYVCPANRPLVQTHKLAKLMLREHEQAAALQDEKTAKEEAK